MCFEIHGYPDWYRDLKKRRQASDKGKGILGPRLDDMAASILETIKAELFKYFGNNDHKESDDPFAVNCAYEFASNVLCSSSYLASLSALDSWVIDSGATRHMFKKMSYQGSTNSGRMQGIVSLPDCRLQTIKEAGTILLDQNLPLKDVPYMPKFKYNLLFVSK